MECLKGITVVIVTSCILALEVAGSNGLFQSDEGITETIVHLIANHPVEYRKAFSKYATMSNENIPDVDRFVPLPHQSSCDQCAIVLEGLKILIPNLNETIVKDFVVDLCTDAVVEQGFDADVICASTVDNYARHVIFIFGNLTKSGLEACELLNLCPTSAVKSTKQREHPVNRISGISKNILQVPHFIHGIQRSKRTTGTRNTIKVAHITDIHVELTYQNGSATTDCGLPACCKNETGQGTGSAHPYGDYNCNPPPVMVEHLLDFVGSQVPDLVAYTGDSPRGGVWTETLENQGQISRWVAEAIGRHIPGVPAYAAFGNHECFPCNMFYSPDPDVKTLIEGFYDSWESLSGFGPEQEETIKTAGYFAIDSPTFPNIKIVSINSNYGFVENWYNLLNDVEAGFIKMKEDIEQALQEATSSDKKVLLLIHHPSGGNVLHYDEWISRISIQYKDTILFAVHGHTHSDSFNIIMDPLTLEPVASHFTEISMDSNGRRNPGVRIYHLDAVTLQPLDYDQYFLNISSLQDPDGTPDVSLIYKASELYGLSDLSPASMYDLTVRFEEDDELWNGYWAHRSLRPDEPSTCLDDCKKNAICDIRWSTVEQRQECDNSPGDSGSGDGVTEEPPPPSTTDAAADVVPSLAMAFLLTCFYL